MRSGTPDQHRHSVVLLGASNLTRSIAVCARTARAVVDGPCDLALVLGHGRSFGMWSNILGRSLPSILECEVWPTLQFPDHWASIGHAQRRCALITDVGNDLGYGRLPSEIIAWLDETVARLVTQQYNIVMTAMPIESLKRLTRRKFEVTRRLFYPRHPITFETAMARVEELDALMRGLAHRMGIRFVEQEGTWFGIDPIHIRRCCYPQAWQTFMNLWNDDPPGHAAHNGSYPGVRSISQWWSLRLATPAHRRIFGIEQRGMQPARRWPDGTEVSLY